MAIHVAAGVSEGNRSYDLSRAANTVVVLLLTPPPQGNA